VKLNFVDSKHPHPPLTVQVHPFITERTRNLNPSLVGTGRPPPAARCRCSHISVSAEPR
jgi:hypothetical protein